MNNVLILHGKPKKERYLDPAQPKPHQANWLPWLAEQLEQRGVAAAIPAFPEPYAPDYESWRSTFEQYQVSEHTGIVGHSAGAGFILRWLSENQNITIERAVLVAPWHDTNHEYGKDFFDYDLDSNLASRVGRLVIFNSIDDSKNIHDSVSMIRGVIKGIRYREFEGYGHFMLGNNMNSTQFPELLEELAHK
jgi:uncharacterized protein